MSKCCEGWVQSCCKDKACRIASTRFSEGWVCQRLRSQQLRSQSFHSFQSIRCVCAKLTVGSDLSAGDRAGIERRSRYQRGTNSPGGSGPDETCARGVEGNEAAPEDGPAADAADWGFWKLLEGKGVFLRYMPDRLISVRQWGSCWRWSFCCCGCRC